MIKNFRAVLYWYCIVFIALPCFAGGLEQMTKTYFNNAVIGNSRMLGCVGDRGELVRLFWPNIDYKQHIEKLAVGIYLHGAIGGTAWLDAHDWRHSQRYVPDTNILETVCINEGLKLHVVQADFVLPEKDVLVRLYKIRNNGRDAIEPHIVLYSSCISTIPDLASVLFDYGCDALIHYKHGCYISLFSDSEVLRFQLGNNAYESACGNDLKGCDSVGMMRDGAISWRLKPLSPGARASFNFFMCVSNTLNGVKMLTREIKAQDSADKYEDTAKYWKNFLAKTASIDRIDGIGALKCSSVRKKDIADIYKRSLLLFKLMTDENTGGLLASPEIDEGFAKCGRYAYCWCRDAAFITEALDRCGLSGAVDRFYRWAVMTQDESGVWHQRYYMDGNLAPSWGLQIDETGSAIWGMLKHYKATRDRNFLADVWDSIEKAVNYLINFIDIETGLPGPSYDIWEERWGEHAYSAAAVHAGIRAGAEAARILGKPAEIIGRWETAAESIRLAIAENLWNESLGRFLRSIRTKLNPWGDEPSADRITVKADSKGCYREVSAKDATIDASLLGISVPFEVFEVNDSRVEKTADAVERFLASPLSGGIKRYENDNYIGGNPWILTTLWLAIYHMRRRNYQKTRQYFEWAVKSRTELDLLPEQVDRETGRPAWVIPLTWSHAMFVLVLMELLDAGEL